MTSERFSLETQLELAEDALNTLTTELKIWKVLARGCKEHRAYRGICPPRTRTPGAECLPCLNIFALRQEVAYDDI